MVRFPCYVLAGGKSSRFGSDKARAALGGEPLIRRVARAVDPVARAVTVVAERADKYADLGLATIADVVPDRGPLGGVLTALRHAGDEWVLVVTCDLVGFEPSWVETLAAARSEARAIAFRSDRWQPFPGLYPAALRREAEAAVASEQLAMGRWLDAVGARAHPLPADWPALVQVNTREELERMGR